MTDASAMNFGQLSVWRDVETAEPHMHREVNIPQIWDVPANFTISDARSALNNLANRHEGLRTTFHAHNSELPLQVVHPYQPREFSLIPASDEDEAVELASSAKNELEFHCFDPTIEYPWTARIISIDKRPTQIILTFHHLVADAWSLLLLKDEFERFLQNPNTESAPSPSSLAREQRGQAWEAKRSASVKYFTRIFSEIETCGAMPPRSVAEAATAWMHSGPALRSMRALSKASKVPLSSVALSVFASAAARTLNVDSILLHAACANRSTPTSKKLVTSMTQWIPIICRPGDFDNLENFASSVNRKLFSAYKYACYDTDEITKLGNSLYPSDHDRIAQVHANFTSFSNSSNRLDPTNNRELRSETPKRTLGPSFLVAAFESDNLTVGTRTTLQGFKDDSVLRFLEEIENIIDARSE